MAYRQHGEASFVIDGLDRTGAAMSRFISGPLFSAHPVFSRAKYAAAVGRRIHNKIVTEMLTQHLHAYKH